MFRAAARIVCGFSKLDNVTQQTRDVLASCFPANYTHIGSLLLIHLEAMIYVNCLLWLRLPDQMSPDHPLVIYSLGSESGSVCIGSIQPTCG